MHTETTAVPAADEQLHARKPDWIENRPAARWWPEIDLAELWSYRDLGMSFALRDVKVRYKQAFFGVAWVLLQPLLAVLIFSIIFGRLAGLPADGIPYPVFVYAGMTIWLYFSGSLSASADCLVGNRDLVSKVYFPRILAPVAAILPGLLDISISLAILGIFLAGYGIVPGPAFALFPLWIIAAAALALAVGLWLSALNVKYRDVKYMLGFLIQVWMFTSPVVYSSSLVQGGWRYLYALNPLVAILDGFRWSVVGGPAPGAEALLSLLVGVVVALTGLVYFRRVERQFADLI